VSISTASWSPYLDILRNCNVEQIVDFSTRGNKTLDIFLTSNPGLIDRCKPIPGVGVSRKEVHMSLMVENGVAVNLLIYAVTSVLNSVILALSHRCIVSVSISTASWSPYLDILRNCNVEQIVDFPTRGNKTLDIFLTSNPGLIDRCKPIPGVGDHDAVLIDTLTIHLWDKANITEFKTEVAAYINRFTATPFSTINDMDFNF
jgi:hypothetical protein